MDESQQPTRESFLNLIGETFSATDETGDVLELVLTAVSEIAVTEIQTSFSVVFTGPSGSGSESRFFTMTQKQFGTTDIFLSPFFADNDGVKFEAIFNRLN